MKHKGDVGSNDNWCAWDGLKILGKKTRGIGNDWKNGNHPDFDIVEIG